MAVIVTLAALPFLWSAKRANPGAESVAALGPVGGVAEAPATGMDGPSARLIESSYLVDPLAGDAPARPGTVTIDVASPADGSSATGLAGYQRWADTGVDRPCGTTYAPFGARVVVTNTDNGYKVACTNVSSKPLAAGHVILLDTTVMLELADLSDSPIPVSISW